MTMLNKMSEGRGASFAEMWYDKMADSADSSSEKTFNKFTKDFEETFFPFNTKATTHLELSKLAQRSFKREDGTNSDGSKHYIKDDGFQRYITNFQNIASKTGITDETTLIEPFSLGLDQQLATMILSITPVSTTLNKWIGKAKVFHTQKQRINALKEGRPQMSFFTSRPQQDPNAMDVDNVTLSKLTPTERAKCIQEGRCFHCRKTGHNATNCRSSWSTPPSNRPQNIRNTETTTSTPPDPAPSSKLDQYINSLKAAGKTDNDIFSLLNMCYEEPAEELAEIRLSKGIRKARDF